MTKRELINALEALPCGDEADVVVDSGPEWHDVGEVRLPERGDSLAPGRPGFAVLVCR